MGTGAIDSRTVRNAGWGDARTIERYADGASADDVRSGARELARGDRGEGVRELQRLLNASGAEPPLAEDGLFGPKTELALMGMKSRAPSLAAEDPRRLGVADRRTWEALSSIADARRAALPNDGIGAGRPDHVTPRAPRLDAPRPEGSVPAGQLARDDEARRRAAQPSTNTPEIPADYRPSGMTSGAPPGYRTITGAVPPGVAAKAKSLLRYDYGTEIPFELDGKRYLARVEHHYHPPGYVGGPNGWHKGVTVYAEK